MENAANELISILCDAHQTARDEMEDEDSEADDDDDEGEVTVERLGYDRQMIKWGKSEDG